MGDSHSHTIGIFIVEPQKVTNEILNGVNRLNLEQAQKVITAL